MKTFYVGALALAAVLAAPASSLAATYAYVNTVGEVMTVEAATPTQAIQTAPNIAVHSGVMTVGADDTDVLGDHVGGV